MKNSQGRVVVATAEEVISLVEKQGVEKTARQVDVVTTGAFGPMCSSGAFFRHTTPRMRMSSIFKRRQCVCRDSCRGCLYRCYEIPEQISTGFPVLLTTGEPMIEDLVAGKQVFYRPLPTVQLLSRQKLEKYITLADVNEAYLFNPRSCYQNYNVAVNLSDRTIYTYMGILNPTWVMPTTAVPASYHRF